MVARCTCIYGHACTRTHTQTHTLPNNNTHPSSPTKHIHTKRAHTHTHTHTLTQTHTTTKHHTHTHTYANTHTHTHTQCTHTQTNTHNTHTHQAISLLQWHSTLTAYFFSPVILERSLNSICMVVTSDVLLSGPQRGAWALPDSRLTSEYGTLDLELKQGSKRSASSTCSREQIIQSAVSLAGAAISIIFVATNQNTSFVGSPFSSKVVVCRHCLVTLSLTITKH